MPLWGLQDTVGDAPKFANSSNSSAQRFYGNVYGVSAAEQSNTSSLVHAPHSGWVSVRAYEDCHGNPRFKAETLVATGAIDNSTEGVANNDPFFANN